MANRYSGNVPSNTNKDAKYSVVNGSEDWEIRLIFRLSSVEKALITTSSHPELVRLVNEVKQELNGTPGGAFYINEYKHVLVPTQDGCWYAGTYRPPLRFFFEGNEISAEASDGLKAGEIWSGPRPGTKYTLSADGKDVRYKCETRPNVHTDRKLSAVLGVTRAAKTASKLSRHKHSGGTIYVNEAFECFGPLAGTEGIEHIYLGKIEPKEWFDEPPT